MVLISASHDGIGDITLHILGTAIEGSKSAILGSPGDNLSLIFSHCVFQKAETARAPRAIIANRTDFAADSMRVESKRRCVRFAYSTLRDAASNPISSYAFLCATSASFASFSAFAGFMISSGESSANLNAGRMVDLSWSVYSSRKPRRIESIGCCFSVRPGINPSVTSA